MKKTVALILLLVFSSASFLTGCRRDDYKLVWSVTYTLDGKAYTERSTYGVATKSSGVQCTEAEFLAGEHKFYGHLSASYDLPRDSKTVQSHGSLMKEDIGEYFYVKDSYYNPPVSKEWYWKYEFAGFGYHYVYVRIVDDDTIVIKKKGIETTYKVSSYSLVYFSD